MWQILIQALENLKNLHFNGFFLIKAYNLWAEKVQRSYIFDGTEEWCKIWRKTDTNMTWRICQIFFNSLKNSNFILESKLMDQINQMQCENFILTWK